MVISAYRRELLLGVAAALLVGFFVFFNDVNIQIRMREVRIFLQRSNRSDNSIDHIGLVMKYRMHKEMYENRMTSAEMNMIEVRINSILAGTDGAVNPAEIKYRYAAIPVTHMINIIRYIIGMPSLSDEETASDIGDIDIAYYYERNRLYLKAIEEYQKILDGGVDDRTLKGGVLLHQGYCYSILGDYQNAKKLYMSVIRDYGDINIAVTAALLLRYIEGFRSEIELVVNSEKDSVEKGEKLYKLIAYRESLEVLNRVENSVPLSEKPRFKYLKGRTYEELGDTDRAVDIYQNIVMDDSSSTYARDANSRIFIIGGLGTGGAKIRELAMKNSEMLNDSAFDRLVEESEKYSAVESKSVERDIKKEDNSIEEKSSSLVKEKKVEKMIRMVDDRMSIKSGRKVKPDTQPEKRMVKIYTSDGNIFTGTIVSESGGTVVVRTSLGDIRIEKSMISRRINL